MIPASTFHWPARKQAAVSLSFDDGRPSVIGRGLPILNRHGIRGTFYVLPSAVEQRLPGWRQAVADGHEIGNHTLSHPCSCSYDFSARNALEDFTLERMEHELSGASEALMQRLGVTPSTFAYPCGQSFIGRGEGVSSYVPLVARRFSIGRGE
ncbi:MAG TPA: polysaccharide deacetylase family protein [Tepidisphaeraceae bacterium]|jgi:peptidoglycan/xylan/chitin deacetylase (PgdA/CDA1 family)